MMKALLFAFCVIVSASIAKADLPKPQQPPQRAARPALHTSLEIATDPKAYEAKLQISESSLKELRAALDNGRGVVDRFPVRRAGAQHPRVAEDGV